MSAYVGVTDFQKQFSFFGPPCTCQHSHINKHRTNVVTLMLSGLVLRFPPMCRTYDGVHIMVKFCAAVKMPVILYD